MAKKRFVTVPSSPTPYNVAGGSHEAGISQGTFRGYMKQGLLGAIPKTPAGHAILFDHHIQLAREIAERNRAKNRG